MNSTAPLLEVRDLSVAFKGGAIQAVDGVDLAIDAGETLAVVGQHPRLLPVGTLDPRYYLNWQGDLRTCVEGGCVAIRFAPGIQHWSPDTLIFAKMVAAIGPTGLPIIVDFNGAGREGLEWIHKVGATAQRHNVPVVMNEVSYGYLGELITVM